MAPITQKITLSSSRDIPFNKLILSQPNDSTRVYRLQTDDGERIVGRRVSSAWVAGALVAGSSALTPNDAFTALTDGKTILDLAEGLHLRRCRVMGANRIELSGFTDVMRDCLSAYGLFHEIISWKLRMFIPTDASGPAILANKWTEYVAPRVMLRFRAWALFPRRSTASTQHNVSPREVA